jgi:hypothetical protein
MDLPSSSDRHELPSEQVDLKAPAFARGQKESWLIAGPITRASNQAVVTVNYEQVGHAVLSTSPQPARTGCLLLGSVEVPALRFNDIDMRLRNIHVTCAQALRQVLPVIGAAAGVGDLVAAAM